MPMNKKTNNFRKTKTSLIIEYLPAFEPEQLEGYKNWSPAPFEGLENADPAELLGLVNQLYMELQREREITKRQQKDLDYTMKMIQSGMSRSIPTDSSISLESHSIPTHSDLSVTAKEFIPIAEISTQISMEMPKNSLFQSLCDRTLCESTRNEGEEMFNAEKSHVSIVLAPISYEGAKIMDLTSELLSVDESRVEFQKFMKPCSNDINANFKKPERIENFIEMPKPNNNKKTESGSSFDIYQKSEDSSFCLSWTDFEETIEPFPNNLMEDLSTDEAMILSGLADL